jgi:hypothetical protein
MWARWPSHSRNPRFLEVQCLTIAGNQSDGGQGGGLDGSANGARPRRGGHQIVGCLLHLLTAAYGTKQLWRMTPNSSALECKPAVVFGRARNHITGYMAPHNSRVYAMLGPPVVLVPLCVNITGATETIVNP